jgi:hypothetical protein
MIFGKGERRLDFRWFSVNEDLDDDLFDQSRIGLREEVLKMLDPVASNATSLISKPAQREINDHSAPKSLPTQGKSP